MKTHTLPFRKLTSFDTCSTKVEWNALRLYLLAFQLLSHSLSAPHLKADDTAIVEND